MEDIVISEITIDNNGHFRRIVCGRKGGKMNKKILVVVVSCLMAVAFVACKRGVKEAAVTGVDEGEARGGIEAKEGAAGPAKSPFDEVVVIFKGFEEIVAKNRDNPKEGVKACRDYAGKNIPRIKSLEENIKEFETTPEYLDEMIDTNGKIKEISDRVTKIVTESYGVEGADILMQLSDMALARL